MSLSRFHDEVVAQHNVTSIYHVVGKSRSREHGAWLPPSRGWGVLIDLLNLCVNSLRSFLPDQPMELALKTLHELLDRPALEANSAPQFLSIQPEPSHIAVAPLKDLTNHITKDEEYPAARGGFGEVWKCTYRSERGLVKVAVKTLIVYSCDQTGHAKEKKIKRIRRELRTCARLKHRNILPVYGWTSGFGPFIAIVSPWAENGNLMTYMERSGATLTIVRRFQLLQNIADGLQYLHANSVIHGDFNGPNVLIHGDGTACLADFGLSLVYSEAASISQASWTSALKGNRRWMAPELLGEREDGSPVRPSKESDVFSFGGIMLQVLTNKIPYFYLSNDAAIILCIYTLETPTRSRYPAISDKYWHFIEQCWSAEPQERPPTQRVVEVVRDELDLLSGSTSSLGGPFGSISENDSGRRNHHLRSNTATSIVIPAATAISHGTDTGVYPGIQPMSTPERGPPIKFNHTGELSGFVNHSPHRVLYGNKMYPTAMHVLEALKFTRHPYMQERIRAHGDVGYVYPLSVSFQEYVRPGWGKLFLSAMEDVLYLKFKQHPSLCALLMNTGLSNLVYADHNTYWGEGPTGTGSNKLGKALVRVRERIRDGDR